MKEPVREGVLWKCPYCDFKNMSKGIVLMHIDEKHKEKPVEEKWKKNQKKEITAMVTKIN